MKRRILPILTLTLLLAVLSGCCLSHEWQEATCVTPKTCVKCEETEGEPLGHVWEAATCETPETCATCGETQGEPLGHTWVEATCEEAKYCSVCDVKDGDPLGHDVHVTKLLETGYGGTCKVCSQEVEVPVEDWAGVAHDLLEGQWKWMAVYDYYEKKTYTIKEEVTEDSSLTFDTAMETAHYVVLSDDWEGDYIYKGTTDPNEDGIISLEYEAVWDGETYRLLLGAGDLGVGEPGRFLSMVMGYLVLYWQVL